MWADLGAQTVRNMIEGCKVMAILWESAWEAGGGDSIAKSKLVEMDQNALKALYENDDFVRSYKLKDPNLKALLTA